MDAKSGAGPSEAQPGSERRVQLSLLNGFELVVGGGVVDLPTPTQKVLALLALTRRALRREFVAGVLWSHCDQRHAAANLRSALWRLRETPDAVHATRTQVRLESRVTVDVAEMESAARRVLALDAVPEPSAVRPGDDPALTDLLDRDLLPDWYDEWVQYDRERLRQMRIGALEQLSIRWRTAGRFALAVDAALAAIRAEPMREGAHEALVEAYLAGGNRSEALRSYSNFRALLAGELGLPPSAALQQRMARVVGDEHRTALHERTRWEPIGADRLLSSARRA